MKNCEIIILDEQERKFKFLKVKDSIFNSKTLLEEFSYLWICEETREFCHFEVWNTLDNINIGQDLVIRDQVFKILDVKKSHYSSYMQ
jgi:hypothetical protein